MLEVGILVYTVVSLYVLTMPFREKIEGVD
jgi:hypothetical protein